MTTYVAWPKTIDADFRAAYADTVHETIQADPPQNAEGTHCMAGSGRILQEQTVILSAQFPDAFFGESAPAWWTDAVQE